MVLPRAVGHPSLRISSCPRRGAIYVSLRRAIAAPSLLGQRCLSPLIAVNVELVEQPLRPACQSPRVASSVDVQVCVRSVRGRRIDDEREDGPREPTRDHHDLRREGLREDGQRAQSLSRQERRPPSTTSGRRSRRARKTSSSIGAHARRGRGRLGGTSAEALLNWCGALSHWTAVRPHTLSSR
jgi:hypothetical protein